MEVVDAGGEVVCRVQNGRINIIARWIVYILRKTSSLYGALGTIYYTSKIAALTSKWLTPSEWATALEASESTRPATPNFMATDLKVAK